jgi:D-alanyl-D-alanine carboxypeptidase
MKSIIVLLIVAAFAVSCNGNQQKTTAQNSKADDCCAAAPADFSPATSPQPITAPANLNPAVYDVEAIKANPPEEPDKWTEAKPEYNMTLLDEALTKAAIPDSVSDGIRTKISNGYAFFNDLESVLDEDPALYMLVDKTHPLPADYVPPRLVKLPRTNAAYTVARAGLELRKEAEASLEIMARAARQDGVTLQASSCYRSYNYQKTAYQRAIDEDGQTQADRESAKPGMSQHQTGFAVDFGSIDDSFAQTRAGRWLAGHAEKYGWSQSYPQGYESITGYRAESWHYRYVGAKLIHFINTYFDGIQQYALELINAWKGLSA